jgi:thiamine kinase-like enzyme
MQRSDIESLADRCVPGAGRVDIQMLRQGPVNETYRVVRDGMAHAVRVAGAKPGGLGVDREWEARVQDIAAREGLAPDVEYSDPERGILVSRWIEGRFWSAAEVRHAPTVRKIAALLRRVHALPIPEVSRRISPRGWIACYQHALEQSAAPRARAQEALRAAADAHLARLARLPAEGPVLCHSDLHTLNVLDCTPSLILLDWEYAHVSEPWWDLAGWSANNDFEDALRGQLLSNYTGRSPTPDDAERLDALCWLYDYTCLLWSELHGYLDTDATSARARLLEARLVAGL